MRLPPEEIRVQQHMNSSSLGLQEFRHGQGICANRATAGMSRELNIQSAATQGFDDFQAKLIGFSAYS